MACLSLNDQAFIFITMTFPSFITTGGTVDIPTVPLERKALDLTPLIQQMMMNKKASSTPADKTKKDEKDPNIAGTTGQTEQWYNNYQRNKSEIDNLINYYGYEVAVTRPEYRRLITEQDDITNPAIVNQLKNNKDRLDAYDGLTKDKKASGMINIDAIGRYGIGMAHSDWSNLLQYAQVNSGLAITNPESFTWLEDFSWTPHIANMDDMYAALDKRFGNIGTSEFITGGGADSVYSDVVDDMVMLVSQHNTSVTNKKSNNNIYGENPTGVGQLDVVKQQALKDAFSNFMGYTEGDDLTNGLVSGFLGKTSAMVPASKIGLPSKNKVKAILQTKAYNDKFIGEEPDPNDFVGEDKKFDKAEEDKYKKAYEEWADKNQEAGKNYSQTHDGYYWKAGQKDKDNKDIGGLLDEEALLGDYERFVTDIVETEHKKRLTTVDSFRQDETKTIQISDEIQKMYNAKKEAEAIVGGANEQEFTVVGTDNLGIPEADMINLLGNKDLLDPLVGFALGKNDWQEVVSTYQGNISQDEIDQMTHADVSPFILNQLPDGTKTYSPNPNFTGDKIKLYQESKKAYAKNQLKYDEKDAERYAKEQTKEAVRVHKSINDNLVAKGVRGSVAYDGTKTYVTSSDPEFTKYFFDEFFEGTGDKKIGKTADKLLGNQLIQVGMTVANGSDFLGNVFRVVDKDEGFSFANVGLANNFGARVTNKNGITINGTKYQPGAFIHGKVVDGMSESELNTFLKDVDFGTNGYWTVVNGVAKSNGRPNKSSNLTGMGPNAEAILLKLNSSGGPNSVAESGTSIMVDMEWAGKKEDVIKYWKSTGKTIAMEVPNFAKADKKLLDIWDEAKTVASSHNIGRGSAESSLQKTAKKLKIKEGTAAYKELEKINNIGDRNERENKIAEAIAIRDGVTGVANWDKRKTIIQVPVINDDGEVIEAAKQAMYLQEQKTTTGDIIYKIKVGVESTQQFHTANKPKTEQTIQTYNNNRLNKLNPNKAIKQFNVNKLSK